MNKPNPHIKDVPNSESAYAGLKAITDAAQIGELKPWSKAVTDLLDTYGISVERLRDLKVQVTVSFPTSRQNRSMAVGVRYAKTDGSYAEDLFLFEENVGLTCYYRGTQEDELPEYDDTHHRKLELSEFLPDVQRDLDDLRQQVEDASSGALPEMTAAINAQANNNRFDVRLVNKSDQTLIAESIRVNDVETVLNQQFTKLYQVPQANVPTDIFDVVLNDILVEVRYRTLDGRQFKLTQPGQQEFRAGDNRYNVVFPSPAHIENITSRKS